MTSADTPSRESTESVRAAWGWRDTTPAFDRAFPEALRERESQLLITRRHAANIRPASRPLAGLALSGGGIRSATFALGVLQALGRHKLLRRFDYLSTVSGGGYIGCFLGRLFSRDEVADWASVEGVLQGDPLAPDKGRPLDFLRDNGNYIAPHGAGDLLTAVGAAIRNVCTVHFVLGILAIGLWIILLGAQHGVAVALGGSRVETLTLTRGIWEWSPWAWLLLPHALVTTALGWAYWLVPAEEDHPRSALDGLALFIAAAACALGLAAARIGDAQSVLSKAGIALSAAAALAVVIFFATLGWRARAGGLSGATRAWLRRVFTKGLGVWLAAGLGFAIFVLVDTGARTIFFSVHRGAGLATVFTSLGAALASGAALRQKLADLLGWKGELSEKTKTALALPLAAGAWALLLLVATALVAHAVADAAKTHASGAWCGVGGMLLAGLALLALSWFMGRDMSFANSTSHQALYAARLTRAYMGASNPNRTNRDVTSVVDGDDATPAQYWSVGAFRKGAPLHIINTTINETVDGASQRQQQDRKGTILAAGPAALSVGIRHHLGLDWDQLPPLRRSRPVGTRRGGDDDASKPHHVFPEDGTVPPFEPLSVGRWIGISGAAFSTGNGYRTNLALAALAGLANVRLGYWWNSGQRGKRPGLFAGRFPVQASLLDEITARFPGTSRQYWNLSDGGHFENMGAYELIRRRLRLILLVDAEQDEAMEFQGLANLVRKARLDFQTEISFLEKDELPEALKPFGVSPALFASLSELARRAGPHATGSAADPEDSSAPTGHAHAALARITYPEDGPDAPRAGWLVYVKPTLSGDESVDVVQYHAAHPDFPHQTTGDQFFDEEQWESYRALGHHIAGALLGSDPGKAAPLAALFSDAAAQTA